MNLEKSEASALDQMTLEELSIKKNNQMALEELLIKIEELTQKDENLQELFSQALQKVYIDGFLEGSKHC